MSKFSGMFGQQQVVPARTRFASHPVPMGSQAQNIQYGSGFTSTTKSGVTVSPTGGQYFNGLRNARSIPVKDPIAWGRMGGST